MHFRISIIILVLFSFSQSHAQTVDQVINKYVKFIGGKKAWKNARTMTTSGEYDYGGIVFPFNTYAKAPDRYKFVVPFGGKYYAQAFDGNKGWKIDAFKNETVPTLLTGKAALAMANESDVEVETPFVDYKQKGHQAVLVGRDSVQGKWYFNIKFTRKNGEIENYFFDEQTFALVFKSAPAKNVELGGTLLNISYSDYRDVEGIKIPFKTVCESNGQMILTITVSKAAINTAIDDNIFQP
jgi:hypothetical protein